MAKTVWITDWEMQCCGEPFEIGSQVTWSLVSADEGFRGRLARLVGEAEASRVTDYETHHGPGHADDPPRTKTTGTVTAIKAAYWLSDATGQSIDGSGRLEARMSADGWEDDEGAGEADAPRFMGYVVDINTT